MLRNSEVATSTNYGIRNSAGASTIYTTDFHSQPYGLYIDGGSLNISSSVIYGNTTDGMYNGTSATSVAEWNYWGDPIGARHSPDQTTGNGDWVSDRVDYKNPLDQRRYIDKDPSTGQTVSSIGNDWRTIRWKNDATNPTIYTSEWSASVTTWNSVTSIRIVSATTTAVDLYVSDENNGAVSWDGAWGGNIIILNESYLSASGQTFSTRQNTCTHELGHAVGLVDSYEGNVMNLYQTQQTSLGLQDESDYNYLWPTE